VSYVSILMDVRKRRTENSYLGIRVRIHVITKITEVLFVNCECHIAKGLQRHKNMSALWPPFRSVIRRDSIKINNIVNFYAPHISFYFKMQSKFELASRLLYGYNALTPPHIYRTATDKNLVAVSQLITLTQSYAPPCSIIALNINGRNCRDNNSG
jgi:hypothetical protein